MNFWVRLHRLTETGAQLSCLLTFALIALLIMGGLFVFVFGLLFYGSWPIKLVAWPIVVALLVYVIGPFGLSWWRTRRLNRLRQQPEAARVLLAQPPTGGSIYGQLQVASAHLGLGQFAEAETPAQAAFDALQQTHRRGSYVRWLASNALTILYESLIHQGKFAPAARLLLDRVGLDPNPASPHTLSVWAAFCYYCAGQHANARAALADLTGAPIPKAPRRRPLISIGTGKPPKDPEPRSDLQDPFFRVMAAYLRHKLHGDPPDAVYAELAGKVAPSSGPESPYTQQVRAMLAEFHQATAGPGADT
jgi:hypothetical protein